MMNKQAKRVLVTGNLGYIGTVLVPLLRERGWHVTGLDTGFFPPDSFFPGGHQPDVQIRADIRDIAPDELPEVEAVVHLAALSNDAMGEIDPRLTNEINHLASMRLAEIMKRKGASRFLFSSSCSIYGAGESDRLTEDADFAPQTAYARSKVDTEAGLRELAGDDFSPCCLRNGTAFGVSPAMRFDLVLQNLAGWAWTTGEIRVLSDGTPWRPMVHIRDISAAFARFLEIEREFIHDKAFNIGRDDNNHQVRDMAGAVCEQFPAAKVVYVGEKTGDRRDYNVSFARLNNLPQPPPINWTMKKGVAEIFAALERYGLSYRRFIGPPANRITQLKGLMEKKTLDPDLRWR